MANARILVAALVALGLGACADDAPGPMGGGVAGEGVLEVHASDFKFEPDEWNVEAGTPFLVEFENDGTVEHEWAVLKLGETISAESEFEEELVLFEMDKQEPGATLIEEFSIEIPGEYQVVCALDGHFDAGMHGTLNVGG